MVPFRIFSWCNVGL